ncbi:hypothetical protein [Embleya sp. NPDC020886]|uniref:hypothetical protein n=1 Tax=Embleya sp. NPDC020886 TaxID=3363980 RepID=UPI0037A791B2
MSVLTGCQAKDGDKDDRSGPPVATTAGPVDPAVSPASVPSAKGEPGTAKPSTSAPSARPTSAGPRKLQPSARAGGLAKLLAGGPTDVPVDPGEVRHPTNNVLVAAFGASSAGPRSVLFVGVDGLTGIDGKRLEHMVRGMVEYVNGSGGGVPDGATMKDYDPGQLGGTLECMPASVAQPAAICGWADRYTTAVAYFEQSSADQAAAKFKAMRADLEK